MNVLGIAGWKNSGKTRLTERLTRELTRRGLSIATIKHAHHGFDPDQPGTDSYRHRMAGAGEVLVSSSRRWALIHENSGPEPGLDQLLAGLSPADLVIVEGFKGEPHPKIETRRREAAGPALSDRDRAVFAIASDAPDQSTDLPLFSLDDIVGIADLVMHRYQLADGPGGRQ